MQLCKAKKKLARSESDVVDLLTSLRRKATPSSLVLRRTKKGHLFGKNGLVKLMQCRLNSRGNRHSSKFSFSTFLEASFGSDFKRGKRIQSRNATSLALHMSPTTVAYMRTITCGSVQAQQAGLLSRIFLMCKASRPCVVCHRVSFDETSQRIAVKGQIGEWQVMVDSLFDTCV